MDHKDLLYYVFNIMAADDLATQGTRVSAAILLTPFSQNSPASAPESQNIQDTSSVLNQGPCLLR